MPTYVFSIGQQLFKPRVNVLWKCKIPGEQAVKTDEPLTLLIPTEGTSLRTMIVDRGGSMQRFRKALGPQPRGYFLPGAQLQRMPLFLCISVPEWKAASSVCCSFSALISASRAEISAGGAISGQPGTVSFVGPSTLPRA